MSMRCAGNAARVGEKNNSKFWYENMKERDHLETLDVNGPMILK
jgi:hypothetical protein